jgi:hypothetical protein
LIEAGYNAVVLDNLHNSSTEAIRRIEGIVNKEVPFEKVDLTDLDAVKAVFAKYPIDSVIHFAGLKVAPTTCRLRIGRWRKWKDPSGVLSRERRWQHQLDQSNARSKCEDSRLLLIRNGLRRRDTFRKHDSYPWYTIPYTN